MDFAACASLARWCGAAGIALPAACGGGADRSADSAAGAVVDSPPAMAGTTGACGAQMKAVLDQHASPGPGPIESLAPAEARRQPSPKDAVMALLVAPGKDTTPLALVRGVTSMDRSDVYDGGARGLAKEANAIVVSVDRCRAPDAKFPAQHDDALAAYRWALVGVLARRDRTLLGPLTLDDVGEYVMVRSALRGARA